MDDSSAVNRYKSALDVASQTVRKEGFFALYKGAGAQWLRIAPYNILQFVAWEQLCSIFNIKAV